MNNNCRIRTNDAEITNHMLWPTELKRQMGKLIIWRRSNQPLLFQPRPEGIHRLPTLNADKTSLQFSNYPTRIADGYAIVGKGFCDDTAGTDGRTVTHRHAG